MTNWSNLVAGIAVAVAWGISSRAASAAAVMPWLVWPLYQLVRQIVGITAGVAFGLGLAAHVYDQLTVWKEQQQQQQQQPEARTLAPNTPFRKLTSTASASILLQDDYKSLMMSAGYLTGSSTTSRYNKGSTTASSSSSSSSAKDMLRGQVIRSEGWQNRPLYAFDTTAHALGAPRHALQSLQELWPALPAPVTEQMAVFMEHLLRDFVACWYSSVDEGVRYRNLQTQEPAQYDTAAQQQQQQPHQRVMLYSLALYRSSPFVDALYESMAIMFGNFATRAEHLNLLHIVLMQWPVVLAHTFRVYRTLRKSVLHKQRLAQQQQQQQGGTATTPGGNVTDAPGSSSAATTTPASPSLSASQLVSPKQQQRRSRRNVAAESGGGSSSNPDLASSSPESSATVSEIAMIKEFLLLGKLHRAITFGLDVPALLFADASGKECGTPSHVGDETTTTTTTTGTADTTITTTVPPPNASSSSSTSTETIDDRVLQDRLFSSTILNECELDYNRVVAHRMIRALCTRQDYGSPIIATLLTEVLGGCVLTPVMSMFGPAYLNSWIIKGLSSSSSSQPTTEANTKQQAEAAAAGGSGETKEPTLESGDPGAESLSDALMGSVGVEVVHEQQCRQPQQPQSSTPSRATTEDVSTTAGGSATYHHVSSPEQQVVLHDLSENAAAVLLSTSRSAEKDILSSSPQQQQQQRDQDGENADLATTTSIEDNIISLLTLALIDLQTFVDFDECRMARENHRPINVNWDDPGCRAAVLRLVLVLELALTHGRCSYKGVAVGGGNSNDNNNNNNNKHTTDSCFSHSDSEGIPDEEEEEDLDDLDDTERPVEVTLHEYESVTLSQILMEMTGDIDAFEERVATENTLAAQMNNNSKYDDLIVKEYKPTPTEQSTLRTLIAAWLHTGQIYRTVTVLAQAHATILAPYYHKNAFLRSKAGASGFVRQLKILAQVDILVDTMTVLSCPRLDETDNEALVELIRKSIPSSRGGSTNRPSLAADERAVAEMADPSGMTTPNATSLSAAQLMVSSSTPRYLDFHRNESFASSLRSERERRTLSWQSILEQNDEQQVGPVCRSRGLSQEDVALHRELHHIARIFYTGTNIIGIRDAARRKNSKEGPEGGGSVSESTTVSEDVHLSLLTVETACPRRRIEVPDDDSSFLLRAQSRTINVVGVHRDQRNHDQSFKCFAATYEEPVPKAGTEHYAGGRYVRRCLVRYYPIDRTASVALQNDARKLDQRRTTASIPESITFDTSSRPAPFLSADFLRERHLCQRWVPKGTARSQSLLASSVVEPADFASAPRTGKAIDFVYKMTFFEKPMIDLGGKHFAVHDAAALGVHRADASALEISDASLSVALLTLGSTMDGNEPGSNQQGIQMGKDGYPLIWMKFSRKQDDAHVEVKPYRISFVRAALMVTAARQEAQLQSLVRCVRAGSAKKATKALTDAHLKPTLMLVEYAGNRSREKQSLLLRDLKLGVNHIDREQLRRNGLLSPRYPTELLEFAAVVEDAVQTTDDRGDFFGAPTTVYKVRCFAKVCLVAQGNELEGVEGYRLDDGSLGQAYQEEWVVYRSFKEFMSLHKHLKSQVSASMSSGTAGSRLVGAATAAFASNTVPQNRASRHRQSLIPSLSQASKAGALGVTKKSILKRKDILNGYIGYLLSPGHLMSRNSELLLFLGAFYPFPPTVGVGQSVTGGADPLGRSEMKRFVVEHREKPEVRISTEDGVNQSSSSPSQAKENETGPGGSEAQTRSLDEDGEQKELRRPAKMIEMIPSIKAKIDKVPLGAVRNRLFELLRYQFGFDNASFIRNRMLAALKTASFAVTSAAEFRKTLYKLHLEYLSANAVAGWIQFGCDTLWPNGVFYTPAPPWSQEELEAQVAESRKVLHDTFPEQVRAILGQELTKDGLDIFHEMLQNRVVVKSMAYMLLDLLWLEIFPEIGDVLQCGSALDLDQ